MNLQITRFDPHKLEERRKEGSPATCVFIGKRGTGKSTLVSDILYHQRRIPMGIVMSATEESNDFYKKHVPDLFIYGEYNKDAITGCIDRQRKAIRQKIPDADMFVLLDDCMYDRKMIRDPNIRGIFMNGRHWKLLFLLTMQYCMDLPPDLRANVDFVFCLRENIIQNQEKLYKNFFGIFPTFDAFKEVMNSCTEGYDCMVLDNTSRSNKIEDCVFWYRAKPNRKFRIGSKALWSHHKKNYNKDHADTEKSDMNSLKKKNAVTINVKKTVKKKKKKN